MNQTTFHNDQPERNIKHSEPEPLTIKLNSAREKKSGYAYLIKKQPKKKQGI